MLCCIKLTNKGFSPPSTRWMREPQLVYRSAFYALRVPILLYGSEIQTLTKTEPLILERTHQKTIQGLPTTCSSSSLTTLLGAQNIETLVLKRMLNIIISITYLDLDELPRKILLARTKCRGIRGVFSHYQQLLSKLNSRISITSSPPPQIAPPGNHL